MLHIKPKVHILVLWFISAPDGSPREVKALALTIDTIHVSWEVGPDFVFQSTLYIGTDKQFF